MCKFIKTFDDYETPMVPVEVNITKEGIAIVAMQFLRDLGKNYDLRKNRRYNPGIGNSAWFTERFYEWSENNRTQCRMICFYYPDEEKRKKPYLALLIGDLVLDFTHKKLSKDRKENFYIGPPKSYIKYGYNEYEILDDFPSWVENSNSLKRKNT